MQITIGLSSVHLCQFWTVQEIYLMDKAKISIGNKLNNRELYIGANYDVPTGPRVGNSD